MIDQVMHMWVLWTSVSIWCTVGSDDNMGWRPVLALLRTVMNGAEARILFFFFIGGQINSSLASQDVFLDILRVAALRKLSRTFHTLSVNTHNSQPCSNVK